MHFQYSDSWEEIEELKYDCCGQRALTANQFISTNGNCLSQ